MKRALISDIHSNLEAFESVLEDIRQQGITEVYCLGDIIGYGPNPRECIDLAMRCDVCLLGNHDQGALFDPEGFNTGAERAIFWTRDQLENPRGNPAENAKRWDFLGELPLDPTLRKVGDEGRPIVLSEPKSPVARAFFDIAGKIRDAVPQS